MHLMTATKHLNKDMKYIRRYDKAALINVIVPPKDQNSWTSKWQFPLESLND